MEYSFIHIAYLSKLTSNEFILKVLAICNRSSWNKDINSNMFLFKYSLGGIAILTLLFRNEYLDVCTLPVLDIKQLILMLCEVMNELVPDHVRSAQQFNGIWSIWLRSTETKSYLLEGNFSLSIGNHCVFLYGKCPIVVKRFRQKKLFSKMCHFTCMMTIYYNICSPYLIWMFILDA